LVLEEERKVIICHVPQSDLGCHSFLHRRRVKLAKFSFQTTLAF
jgi:hypothetical protein